jgi:hypothetical protein
MKHPLTRIFVIAFETTAQLALETCAERLQNGLQLDKFREQTVTIYQENETRYAFTISTWLMSLPRVIHGHLEAASDGGTRIYGTISDLTCSPFMLVLVYGFGLLSLFVAIRNGSIVFGVLTFAVVGFFLARIVVTRVKIRQVVLDGITYRLL